jgi:hypothetical protein
MICAYFENHIDFVYISAGVVTMANRLTIISLLIVAVLAGAST